MDRILVFPDLKDEALVVFALPFLVLPLNNGDEGGQAMHRIRRIALETEEACPGTAWRDTGGRTANDRQVVLSIPGDDNGIHPVRFANDKLIWRSKRQDRAAPFDLVPTFPKKQRDGIGDILVQQERDDRHGSACPLPGLLGASLGLVRNGGVDIRFC